ncbi:MAG: hypothetical protein IPM56_10665 [Ignavibacteriales bacterium]|nr:MAG: hypothetical protein IPM56_10665 [Ignavibacteriales bacterium]
MRTSLLFLLLFPGLIHPFGFNTSIEDSISIKQKKYDSIYKLVINGKYTECEQIINELINDKIYLYNLLLQKQVLDDFNSGKIKEKNLKQYFELFNAYDNHLLKESELDLYRRIFDQYAPFQMLKAFNFNRLQESGKAKLVYDKLISEDSTNYLFYSCRGDWFSSQLMFDSALIDYTTALRLNPESDYCYLGAGLIYDKQQDYKKAYEMLSKVKLFGLFSTEILRIRTAYNNYAAQLMSEKNYELALSVLDESLSFNDSFNDRYQDILFTNRGIVKYKLKKYEDALNDFDEALYREGDTLKICKSRYAVFLELKQNIDAIKDLNYILIHEPSNTSYLYIIGEIYYEMEDYSKVLVYMKKILTIEPDNTSALYLCGVSCDFLKMYKEAVDHYNDFIRYEKEQQDKRYLFVQKRAVELIKTLKQ